MQKYIMNEREQAIVDLILAKSPFDKYLPVDTICIHLFEKKTPLLAFVRKKSAVIEHTKIKEGKKNISVLKYHKFGKPIANLEEHTKYFLDNWEEEEFTSHVDIVKNILLTKGALSASDFQEEYEKLCEELEESPKERKVVQAYYRQQKKYLHFFL